MNRLWQPDKQTNSSISSGNRKLHLHFLKPDLRSCECPYCKKDVYYYDKKHKYLTLSGSDHRCKGMPDDRI